jgi:hypothetical protein
MTRSLTMLALVGVEFSAAQALTFTGDVSVDFAGSGAEVVVDGPGDVGLPYNAPVGTVSGWDIEETHFDLDLTADELNIGIAFYGTAGDADGDGGEGTTSPWLASNGGVDLAGLGMTESICVAFDFDQNGTWDVIAGVGSWDDSYQVAAYNASPLGQSFSFGTALPNANGHAAGSDFELGITGISSLDAPVDGQICFDYSVFAGSIQDDGIGEDIQFGTICLTDDTQVSAEVPVSLNLLSAYPNPFNPTTTLQVELAQTGMVELAVYNLNGQLVRTLASGMMEVGSHAITLDASALPSGLYLARLATEQGVSVERLLLTK